MDDLRIVAARLWILVGRKPVPSQDLAVVLYKDLGWFPPTQSEQLVRLLQDAKLLLPGPTPGTLVAAPQVQGMDVPITYRPPSGLPKASLRSVPEDLLSRVLSTLAPTTGESESTLREETQRAASALGVEPEAAALLVAWRRGIPLPELREEVDRRLRSEAPAR